jgi:hypothetical protein
MRHAATSYSRDDARSLTFLNGTLNDLIDPDECSISERVRSGHRSSLRKLRPIRRTDSTNIHRTVFSGQSRGYARNLKPPGS